MLKKLLSNVLLKTISQIEKEENITESVVDLSPRYLGLPPSKRFYKPGEVDIEKTRAKFNKSAKRMGLNVE